MAPLCAPGIGRRRCYAKTVPLSQATYTAQSLVEDVPDESTFRKTSSVGQPTRFKLAINWMSLKHRYFTPYS